jgi:hypothetical protein
MCIVSAMPDRAARRPWRPRFISLPLHNGRLGDPALPVRPLSQRDNRPLPGCLNPEEYVPLAAFQTDLDDGFFELPTCNLAVV